jgi:amino acid transporter
VLQLVFLTYAVICSGAYGLEEMVSASGPGIALLSLSVLPVIWAAPVSLACAELSSLYPVEGGYYRWARMAFGDLVGYMAGWLVWLSTFTTNAAFAVLFANYIRYWLPDLSPTAHFAFAAGLVWVTTFLNYRGIRLVGNLSIVFTCLIFVPFLAITLLGLAHWRFNPLVPFVNPEKSAFTAFGDSLFIAIWLFAGFEKLSANAEEVEDPSRAFPIALAWAVPLAALSYIIPTVAALAALGDWRSWGEAHFSAAAEAIGGPLLGNAMAAGGLIGNVSLLMVTLLAQSRLPMVLAEDGLFPPVFGRTHPVYKTPSASLLLGGVVLTGLCLLTFSSLAGLYALVQALAYLLIYASLFRLRSHPTHSRRKAGFRIPLGRVGLAWMVAPSVVLAGLVVVHGAWHDGGLDTTQLGVDVLMLASGPATYYFFRRRSSASPPSSP